MLINPIADINTGMEDHVSDLLGLFEDSLGKCLRGQEQIGLVYSSGLDSAFVGFKASEQTEVRAYNVGFPGAADRVFAEKTEKDVPFPIRFVELDELLVEDALPNVIKAIGEPNPLKASVGIPFYFASKRASEDGHDVMLCGQGPDELFGGYSRYLDVYAKEGYGGVEDAMRSDVMSLHASQLIYDERVVGVNGVKLLYPFLDEKFVRYTLSTPIELRLKKVSGEPEYSCVDEVSGEKLIRKYLFREVAKMAGVPYEILNRPKKAAQYGSGTMKTIEKLARKRGYKKEASKLGRTDYVRYYIERLFDGLS